VGGAGGGALTIEVVSGPLVVEVRQSFAPWLNQTVRLVKGAAEAELSFSVGPVPVDDGVGKEVVSALTSSVDNGNGDGAPVLRTDSNGREFLTRVYNSRPTWNLTVFEPVAGNYYPTNAAAYIASPTAQLSVVVDRSVGSASLAAGELEVMVHRRILADDSRGVGEPLDEYASSATGDYLNCKDKSSPGIVVAGTHRLQLRAPDNAMAGLRASMTSAFAPVVIAFAPLDTRAARRAQRQAAAARAATGARAASAELQANVKLLTLQAVGAGALLVRLEHAFAVGEDATLSAPAAVNLTALLVGLGFSPTGAEELTLTANQPLEDLHRLAWPTNEDQAVADQAAVPGAAAGGAMGASVGAAKRKGAAAREKQVSNARALAAALGGGGDGVVTLNPMEIRTAVVYV